MDRDKRWDRIEKAFGAMVLGNGHKAMDPIDALRQSYEGGVTDEFAEPVTIVDRHKDPVGLIRDEDVVIFYNFRADRARQLTTALTQALGKLHFQAHRVLIQFIVLAVASSGCALSITRRGLLLFFGSIQKLLLVLRLGLLPPELNYRVDFFFGDERRMKAMHAG